MKVVRKLVYEGTDEAILTTLSRSLPDGVKEVRDLTITVVTQPSVGGWWRQVRRWFSA